MAGCARPADRAADAPGSAAWSAADTSPVVAVVDGAEVRAGDVARQARLGRADARAALAALIEFELLAREARRRGFHADPEVVERTRQAAVARLIAERFERAHGRERIPEPVLRRAFERRKAEFDHPDLREVAHVLVSVAPDAPAAHRAAARALAGRIAAQARDRGGVDELRALAEEHAAAARAGTPSIDVRLEGPLRTSRNSTAAPFADAVFALPAPGATSGVIETRFGFHVARLLAVLPERRVPFERAADGLRDAALDEWRQVEFLRWVAGLARAHAVERHDAVLASLSE